MKFGVVLALAAAATSIACAQCTAADAPADAIVLFDGRNTDHIVGKNGAPCPA